MYIYIYIYIYIIYIYIYICYNHLKLALSIKLIYIKLFTQGMSTQDIIDRYSCIITNLVFSTVARI